MIQLSEEVRDVLQRSQIEGMTLRLPGALDPKLYKQVDKVLRAAGGTWVGGKRKVHVFTAEPASVLGLAVETGAIVDAAKERKTERQAFYTPQQEADRIGGKYLNPKPGLSFCDPSCGNGRLARTARTLGMFNVTCIDIAPEALAEVGDEFYTIEWDFLELRPQSIGQFDRIFMNPPWQHLQDLEHVRHAYDFLKPGGRLVAITSDMWETKSSKKAADLRGFLIGECGMKVVEKLPKGTFKESGTMFPGLVVVIDKPKAKKQP